MSLNIVIGSTASVIQLTQKLDSVSNKHSIVQPAIDVPAADNSKLSVLSRQLAESAVRAEARDASLSFSQLGAEAERLLNQILGVAYQAAKPCDDLEEPNTSDGTLLARAKLATDFVVRADHHDKSAENPFEGLSRDQLNLIVYDEKGPYTINERRAAFRGVSAIEIAWRQNLFARFDFVSAPDNSRRAEFFAEVLDQYRSLTPIERSRLPEHYEAELKAKIEASGGDVDDLVIHTLFEILARFLKYQWSEELTVETESPGATASCPSGERPSSSTSSDTNNPVRSKY